MSEEDLNRGLLLSRFGVWILASQCRTVSLCKSDERLGYLISVVLDWMTATAAISDKGVRAKIETLKKEYISNWINVVKKANLDLYCTCLLPDPPAYVQMQGTSDMLADKIRLLKEGLYRICCLIPYNLVPQEVRYCELMVADTKANLASQGSKRDHKQLRQEIGLYIEFFRSGSVLCQNG